MQKSLKKSTLTILVVFFSVIVVFAITEGLYYLFLFPILALSFFLFYYLYRQGIKDEETQTKRAMDFAQQEKDAEKWMQNSFAPSTLSIIKTKRWMVIFYSFVFVLAVTFLWSYLSDGLVIALRNFIYAALLFWLAVMYLLLAPHVFDFLHKLVPKRFHQVINGDWERGYIFLLPITFVMYLLYPFADIQKQLMNKLISFPLFFIVYTSLFIGIYCIVYLYQDIQKEDEKRVKKEVKELLKQ